MLNCVIIDDDQEEIDIFKMAVSEMNFNINCGGFTECSGAINSLTHSEDLPDFIFLDSNLSGIDGRECLRKIKAEKKLEDIPVVIFSGYVSDDEKLKYMELGAVDCILKAHSLTDLQNKLNGFFAKNYRLQA